MTDYQYPGPGQSPVEAEQLARAKIAESQARLELDRHQGKTRSKGFLRRLYLRLRGRGYEVDDV